MKKKKQLWIIELIDRGFQISLVLQPASQLIDQVGGLEMWRANVHFIRTYLSYFYNQGRIYCHQHMTWLLTMSIPAARVPVRVTQQV